MLAHAASAQGISAVENICGRSHVVNHAAIPAACFTHPEVRGWGARILGGGLAGRVAAAGEWARRVHGPTAFLVS